MLCLELLSSACQRHMPAACRKRQAAAPPSSVMKSRRFIFAVIRSPRRRDEELVRHSEAEHPGRLVIDDQFELARLLDRQFLRLRTLENATGIDADDTPRIRDVGSHQPAGFGDFTRGGSHGNRVARRHGAQLNPPAVEKSAGADEEGIG
jgi:hypothetical protein